MTTLEKRRKMSELLKKTALRLMQNEIGERLWDSEESAMNILASELYCILTKCNHIEESLDNKPRTLNKIKKRTTSKKKESETSKESWPDLLTDT